MLVIAYIHEYSHTVMYCMWTSGPHVGMFIDVSCMRCTVSVYVVVQYIDAFHTCIAAAQYAVRIDAYACKYDIVYA